VTAAQITAYAVSSVLAASCRATLVQVTDGCDHAVAYGAAVNNALCIFSFLDSEEES